MTSKPLYEDSEIIRGLLNSTPEIGHYIFRNWRPVVIGITRKYLGAVGEAEDVFQEGLCGLFQNLLAGKYKAEGKLEAYFMMICRNICRNQLRQQKKNPRTLPLDSVEWSIEAEEELEEVVRKERKTRLILEQIELLGEMCRKILLLFYQDEKSQKAIAEEIGKDVPFVKLKKHRCMEKLRKKILTIWKEKDIWEEISDLKDSQSELD